MIALSIPRLGDGQGGRSAGQANKKIDVFDLQDDGRCEADEGGFWWTLTLMMETGDGNLTRTRMNVYTPTCNYRSTRNNRYTSLPSPSFTGPASGSLPPTMAKGQRVQLQLAGLGCFALQQSHGTHRGKYDITYLLTLCAYTIESQRSFDRRSYSPTDFAFPFRLTISFVF